MLCSKLGPDSYITGLTLIILWVSPPMQPQPVSLKKSTFIEGYSSSCLYLTLSFLCFFSILDFLDFDIGVKYGDRYKIVLTSKVETVEVRYRNKLAPVVLWSNTNPLLPQSRSRKRIGIYYILYNLTQDDNGQYITKDKTGLEMEVYNIHVKGEFFKKLLI